VVQLQLLHLTIQTDVVVVPMDVKVRVEVIDLMARILVAVFEAQEGKADESGLVPSQDQAGALGSQSHRLLTAVEREAVTAEQGEPAPPV
jgi:hypothetical protein